MDENIQVLNCFLAFQLTGVRESRDLMTPAIPALGPTMAQNNQRTTALQGKSQANAIGSDGLKLDIREQVELLWLLHSTLNRELFLRIQPFAWSGY